MKRLVIALCIGLLCYAHYKTALSFESKDTKAERDVVALVRQLTEAQRNYDSSTMDQILAPDYVEISPVGAVDGRAKVLTFYTPEEKKKFPGELLLYELDESSVRTYGNMAIVVTRLRSVMKSTEGQTLERALRCVFVCRKHQDRWQVVSAQYTGITKES